jgi:hypothetical protein
MRVELPSGGWVDLKELDDLMGEDLLIIAAAAKITSGKDGETVYAPKEMENDRANAFLGQAITSWSFAAPVPRDMPQAPADKVIGRTLKIKDYAALLGKAKVLLKEIDDLEQGEDPKEPPSPSLSST